MDPESIFRRPGREWTDGEKTEVSEWLFEPAQLCQLIRIVFGVVRRCGRDLDFAEDVVGQVLADLWQRRYDTYDPARSAGSARPFWRWVCVAVWREAVRAAQKEARREQSERRLAQEIERRTQEAASQASRSAFDREGLERCIAHLPPLQREAIEFRMDGLSHQQAGELSHQPCSAGAMRVRLLYARRTLLGVMGVDQGGAA